MRMKTLGYSALSAAIVACIPLGAHAQLEEVVVTATRRETDLQSTPLSIQAFTAEDLQLGGIEQGRDLGIMVPNVVLNPSTGGGQARFYIRGLPGVGLYVDGVWQDGFGFQQMNFDEFERVEVLRGPQGTLFGRNTNGGAVNITTRRPGDEFAARVNLEVGEFNRRNASVAVDLPITDNLKTKFMGATAQSDGFLEGLTTPWDFGSQDDSILRADVLWEPTDSFSLRFTVNDETKRGTDPRVHQMTRFDNSKIYAHNIMLGYFQSEANARCASSPGLAPTSDGMFACNGTSWPTPPAGFGERFTGAAESGFTPSTHTTNYQGGVTSNFRSPYVQDRAFTNAEVGKWQTRSDSAQDGITADLRYTTLTLDWDITDNLNFELITSQWEQDQRQVIDFDGTEFLVTTDDINEIQDNQTFEIHLSGTTDNGRISWLAGYYSLEETTTRRFYRWGMWDFVVPNQGTTADPALNVAYNEYVRDTAYLLQLNGVTTPGVPSGGNMLSPSMAICSASAPVGSFPYNRCRYNWNFYFISADQLTGDFDDDEAFFGEATFSVTDKLDITVGYRQSDKQGGYETSWDPIDAFRTSDPDIRPQGDMFAGINEARTLNPDLPKVDTYKFGVTYQITDDIMVYGTYAEGFTSGGQDLVTIGEAGVLPSGCVRFDADQCILSLEPEVIENNEIGLRSDWLGGQLRFNATYFDSTWNNMRITQLPVDGQGNTQPFPFSSGEGAGTADGWEFEVIYAPTDRLQLNLGLGLIDTNYIQSGVFDGVTGNYPGAPFAYASENSGTVGATYDIPLSNGGQLTLVGNYGWMDDYARDAAYQRTKVDANGNPVLEPGYGILNARLVYEPAERNYSVQLWGRNLTDEFYINGGFDTRDTWGYDFSVIGRSREVGVSLSFEF